MCFLRDLSNLLKELVLSDSMQQTQGSPPHKSGDSPTKASKLLQSAEKSMKSVNFSNSERSYLGCASNLNHELRSNSAAICNQLQPETLNLPAVLWDKPAGSKIRVAPPVPPRSPRRANDPVASGAFEAAMALPDDGGSNVVNSAPQRGWTMEIVNHFLNLFLILTYQYLVNLPVIFSYMILDT